MHIHNDNSRPVTVDGHFPLAIKRDDEERLLKLAASRTLDPDAWKSVGPAFFMAGLAVMLAGVRGLDRPGLLALAERLHPGSSEVKGFTLWLAGSPVRPSRFIALLKERLLRATTLQRKSLDSFRSRTSRRVAPKAQGNRNRNQ